MSPARRYLRAVRSGLGRLSRQYLSPSGRRERRTAITLDGLAKKLDRGDYRSMVTTFEQFRARPRATFKHRWEDGIGPEIEHWTRYLLRTVKVDQAERFRLEPELPLAAEFTDRIVALPEEEVRILDVGAGPLTTVGKRWAGHRVRIVPVDALAERYDSILSEADIEPPIRTVPGEAERLVEQFGTDHFHFVYCANALDHCYDPLGAIDQMLQVVRPGGSALLRHFPNEAEAEGYSGFHQWNIWSHRGQLIIWNRNGAYHVNRIFAGAATTEMIEDGRLVTCYLRKR